MKLDWATDRFARLSEFSAARRILEIGAGSFGRSAALAAAFPEKTFYSTDLQFPKTGIPPALVTDNLHLSRGDMHDMPFRDGYFDFAFSVALMEHISDVPRALDELRRVLRPRASYYFIQAPFWSCAKGHHFLHWKPEIMNAIPLYGHLYLSREEMREALSGAKQPFSIDECISRIYDRSDLSRLSRNQTFATISRAPFDIASWQDYDDTAYDAVSAKRAFKLSKYSVAFDEMKICGAYVHLKAA